MTTPDFATPKNRAGQPGPTPLGLPTPACAEPGADASAQARIADLEAINRTLTEQLTAAREQYAMLERLVDASPVVLFHSNWPLQKVDYISPNIARIWGLESREVTGRSGFKYDHICPEDRSRFIAELMQALENKAEQVELNYRLARHDGGGEQWARTVIHFEYGPDGVPLATAGYSVDDTPLVKTEETLQRRNTGLATLLEISQRLSYRFDLTELLDVIVPCALNTLDSADADALWLYDKNTDTLHRCHHAGHDSAALRHTVPVGEPGFLTEIYNSRQPSHVPDAFSHPVIQLQPDGASAPIGSAAGVPVLIDNRAVGVLAVVNFAATDSFGQQDTRLLQLMASTIGLALKNTQLYQTEYDSHQFTEVIHAAGAALSQTLELSTVLDTLLAHVHKLIPYDSASVMLLQNDGAFTFDAGRGYPPPAGEKELSEIRLHPRDTPILEQIARERHSIVIEDTTRHPDWRKLPQSGHIRSWLGVPLIANDQLIGIFSLDKSLPHFFTGWHRNIAEALSTPAALSVANARLFDAVRTTSDRLRQLTQQLITAQEDERRRLARDLHDMIGSSLYSLKIYLAQIDAELPPDNTRLRSRSQAAASLAETTMTQLRDLSRNLRPATLDSLGLGAALESYCLDITVAGNVQVEYQGPGAALALPPSTGINLYRFVQEALSNVIKHASATECLVALSIESNSLVLTVSDNGVGFDLSAKRRRQGMGLDTMLERITALGGHLDIDTYPGRGACLTVRIPHCLYN